MNKYAATDVIYLVNCIIWSERGLYASAFISVSTSQEFYWFDVSPNLRVLALKGTKISEKFHDI